MKSKREGIFFKRIVFCIIVAMMLLVLAACVANEEISSIETDLPDSGAMPVEAGPPDLPEDSEAQGGQEKPKSYDNFSEAYLAVLACNKQSLIGAQLSDARKSMGLDTGDGKIAIVNVYGDETPELLYIYNESDVGNNLAIYTYSEEDGAISIFDYNIYSLAGGEGYYCVYLMRDGELMGYYARGDAVSYYGFWMIFSAKAFKYEGGTEVMFDYNNLTEAQLYSGYLYSTGEAGYTQVEGYTQYGAEISKEQFDRIASEIMDNIDRVLFQGPVQDGEFVLYKYRDLWKDITPFEEDCMSYAETVAWLESPVTGD